MVSSVIPETALTGESQFASELDVPSAARPNTDDCLSEFGSEFTPVVPATDVTASGHTTLLSWNSLEGRRSWLTSWRIAISRWAMPTAIAVLLSAPSVLVGWHALRPNSKRPMQSAQAIRAHQFTAPSVVQGIQALMLMDVDLIAIARPVTKTALPRAAQDERAAPPSSTRPSVPSANRIATPPTVVRAARDVEGSVQRAEALAGIDTSTIVPLLSTPGSAGDARVLNVSVPEAPHAAAAPSAAESTQEFAVRRTLRSYEDAYENLDVARTAEVWPTVDRRALSRAFDTLKSQGLEFESCAITVTGARATAQCRGTLQFVRKVGNPLPLTTEQQWVFTMRRLGAEWKIDQVSASQAPVVAAQRTRGQG
jgi:hypothetical protein